jgi:2'-5' RNA ligase
MNLRCFIAIDLSDQIKKELADLIEVLKKSEGDIKWIRPENLHLTLKFLGSTPEELIPKISESLSDIISSYRPFCIKIYGTGTFPGGKNPRVIWVGTEGSETLEILKRDIEKAMSSFGYQEEDNDFRPHLTIGRVRSRKGMIETSNRLGDFEGKDFGTLCVDRIKLMKSELRPKGAEYKCLYELVFRH